MGRASSEEKSLEVSPANTESFWQSLIFRVGVAMAGIIMLATGSMLASILIADASRGDATAVNQAGSLRMRTYQMISLAHAPESSPVLQETLLVEFERTLLGDAIADRIPKDSDNPLRQQYDSVIEQWNQQIRPNLAQKLALAQADHFVEAIDRMVSLIQQQAEQRIQLLRLTQGVTLFLTLGLIFFTMYKLLTDVVRPLRELMEKANEARRGNFAARVSHCGRDELGLLGNTFNLMAEDLSHLYDNLEQRVVDKTRELTRSNRSLQLLYQSARQLGGYSATDKQGFRELLLQAEDVIGLGTLSLCLTTENAEQAYRRITTVAGRPPGCQAPDCSRCLGHPDGSTAYSISAELLTIPIIEAERRFGVILVQHPADQPPLPWQLDLLHAIANHIATALSLSKKHAQQHRIALMEERATIARELHDSLAQSLSYLKIQISRLQTQIKRQADAETLDGVIGELRNGLSSAYRQLRELLGTFRLRVDAPGLKPALENTVAEFSQRGDINILLDYRLGHCPLRPNEEIHVLQIVREAVANVLHHAHASHVEIRLRTNTAQEAEITISDNGIGLPSQWQQVNHYGLTIMRERAERLGGKLTVGRRETGGTEVALHFRPESLQDSNNILVFSK